VISPRICAHMIWNFAYVLYRENLGRWAILNINNMLLGHPMLPAKQSVLPYNLAAVGPIPRGHVMDVTWL